MDVSIEELEAVVARVEGGELEEGDAQLIRALVETFIELSQVLQEKNISISRLRKMLFGPKSEKSAEVMKDLEGEQSGSEKSGKDKKAEEGVKESEEENKKSKGHGRNGVDEYRAAQRIGVKHPTLKPGDRCPECPKGRVYPMKPSRMIPFDQMGELMDAYVVYDGFRRKEHPGGYVDVASCRTTPPVRCVELQTYTVQVPVEMPLVQLADALAELR